MTVRYVATTGNDTTGDGSVGNPYLTIGKANTASIAGDLIMVEPGSYPIPVAAGFALTVGGTAGSPITIKSQVKWGAKFVPVASYAGSYAIRLQADYIIFQDFEMDESGYISGNRWQFGVYMTGSHCAVNGCKIHDLTMAGYGGNGGAGIELEGFYGGTHNSIDSCQVYRCGGTAANNNNHGIYIAGISGTVTNNVIYQCAGWGIVSYHDGTSGVIANNTVFNNHSGGIAVSFDLSSAYHITASNNWLIFNNIVRDHQDSVAGGHGIVNAGGTPGVTTPNWAENNDTFNNVGGDGFTNFTTSGNITTDPLMVNFVNDGSGNYHLTSSSPAKDTGLASLQGTAAPNHDFDGLARPYGTAFDMGAFEFGVPSVGWYVLASEMTGARFAPIPY